jgi:hypothetical protein
MCPEAKDEGKVFVRCESIDSGPGPSEKIVSIRTAVGCLEEVVVHQSFVRAQSLEVEKVGERNGSFLVELPGEAVSGSWRLWVSRDAIEKN